MDDVSGCPASATDEASAFEAIDSIGLLSAAIVQLTRSHRLLAALLLRPLGLHPFQELVLMRLWDAGPQRQADLAQYLGADKATITRSIQRLEAGGFVRCQASPDDKRATVVEASTASRAIQADVEQVWRQLETIAQADLIPSERDQALGLLQRMQASFDAAVVHQRNFAGPLSGA